MEGVTSWYALVICIKKYLSVLYFFSNLWDLPKVLFDSTLFSNKSAFLSIEFEWNDGRRIKFVLWHNLTFSHWDGLLSGIRLITLVRGPISTTLFWHKGQRPVYPSKITHECSSRENQNVCQTFKKYALWPMP